MRIADAIKRRLRRIVARWARPVMLVGWRRGDGTHLPLTRVSTSTYLEAPAKLQLGDNVFIGHFNFIDASGGLSIGEGCQITNFVSVLTHSSHIALRLYGAHYLGHQDPVGYRRASVDIGAYSFVGPHSVIMPGSRIGKGCLIAAYSYVDGEVPDFAIVKGNPAQVVGDTRTLDAPYLAEHPELAPWYQAWAGEQA